MDLLHDANLVVAILGASLLLAVLGSRLAAAVSVPAPLVFLVAGAIVAAVSGAADDLASIPRVETVGVFALIFILFDGGFHGGLTRMRSVAGPVFALGLVGTAVTTVLLAGLAHYVLGLPPEIAVLLGIALAPTDPAAVFSVLGTRTLQGRSRIILEGESGANDPVSIALMLGAIEYLAHDGGSPWQIAGELGTELLIGLVVGACLGWVFNVLLTHLPLGTPALHALGAVAAAFLIYPAAAFLHGSGFLAVFVAGLVIGNADVLEHETSQTFLSAMAALSEIAMFTLLGLTAEFALLEDVWLDGTIIFVILALVLRPAVTTGLLLPSTLTRQEIGFISWGGLKGAVPILLAGYPILAGLPGVTGVYETVFVVVFLSMLIQGSTLPALAARLGLVVPAARELPHREPSTTD